VKKSPKYSIFTAKQKKTLEKPILFEFFYCRETEYMVNFQYKEKYGIEDFRAIIALLRSEEGCPWDKVQTHESIRRNLLEEAYEAVTAINHGDMDNLREELGDLQMQVLFHSQIEVEKGGFTFDDVCDEACKKLIRRHPHVFGDVDAQTPEDVLVTWDAVKRQEKAQKTTARAMADVADALPALWRAEKIQSKAHKEGFDWPDHHGAREKLTEELGELDEAIASGTGIEEELGDVLAAAVNLARLLNIDPEKALNGSSDRFVQRYTRMEELAEGQGTSLSALSLEEKEALWQRAKQELNNQ
jgi:tetrapyrrole methylase family protein/MazG family protein